MKVLKQMKVPLSLSLSLSLSLPLLLLVMAVSVSVTGCAVGFNKKGFYCTEGPVSDDTPSCFRTTIPAKAAEPATAVQPEAAAKRPI